MFRAVALGIAMGNASEGLKNVADYVTSSVEDDRIAQALNILIK